MSMRPQVALIMVVLTALGESLSVHMPQAEGLSVSRYRAAPRRRYAVSASATEEQPEEQGLQRPPDRPRARSDRTHREIHAISP